MDWQCRPVAIFGLVFWNRTMVRQLLPQPNNRISFHRTFEGALVTAQKTGGSIIGWSSRVTGKHRSLAREKGIVLLNMEDGFVRSVGLGAGLTPATSLIIDQRGIYYDPGQPSDLEDLLNSRDVTEAELARGEALRQQLCDLRISKYNLAGPRNEAFTRTDKVRILVPGQVSDDAAIRKTGCESLDLDSGANPNLLLLKRVRSDNPDAFILFKPHPDVQAGLRKGHVADSDALIFCDAVAKDGDILDLVDQCDRLETISSLSGFEALLRGKPVVTHGQPFYAGWGLTEDHSPVARRKRTRKLAELVFLALVAYSAYVHPITSEPCEAEEAIAGLAQFRENDKHQWRRKVGLALAWVAERLGL